MNIDALFYEYNTWWEPDAVFPNVIVREKILASLVALLASPDVLMLTGLRRVGKTTMMKCLIRHLIEEQDVDPKHCCYISLDDYQLKGVTLPDIIECYRRLVGLSVKQHVYLFLDEITALPDFQVQLKNLYDRGVVKCIVSSSSSSVLKDTSAHLTGRKRVVEVDPLDFDEYLLFRNVELSPADAPLLERHFLDYMRCGGMPEYVLRQDREYLVNLIDDIIMKDIVGFHGLRNPQVLKEFFILLMERAGKQVSINKLANILKISPDSAKRYLTMFEAAYLVHLVSRDGKTNETVLSAKKIYATDVGMRNVTVGFRDKGAVFENIAYMRLKRYNPRYVLFNGQEIDFILSTNVLVEIKYQRALEGKQAHAFEAHPAGKKVVISGVADLMRFE